jgi:uncharacterized surface protein with fasciclin (FAS1) repeats
MDPNRKTFFYPNKVKVSTRNIHGKFDMTQPMTIAETLATDSRFSRMAQAIRATGFETVLAGKGAFTVCAPTDEAFRRLQPELLTAFVEDPQGKLLLLVQYHILYGSLSSSTLKKLNFPKTRLGTTVEITEVDGRVLFGGATIIIPDIVCSNGMIHGIERVVIPK